MPFMHDTLERGKKIWDACIETPFVQELKEGTLPPEKFKEYMIQDSIYLKHYARIYGKAIYHASTLKEIQLYYSALSFVTDTESAVRLKYLEEFGMTDDDIEHILPFPENQNYIDFMEEAAKSGDSHKILMCILPCMMSYCYMFRKIATEPDVQSSRYWDFISDYADDKYDDACHQWYLYAEEKCDNLPLAKRRTLFSIFEKASLLELDFWKMAYRGKRHE